MVSDEQQHDILPEAHVTLIEHSPFGVLVGDQMGRIMYMNPALRAMLGYSMADIEAGCSWFDLTPPEFAERDAQAIAEIGRTGACVPYEKAYLANDGRRVPVLVGATAIDHLPNGSLLIAAFVTDLTPLRQAEQTLKERETQLQFALSAAQIGAWDLDFRTNEVYRSVFTDAIFGLTYTEGPRPAADYFARIHPDDLAHVQSVIERNIVERTDHIVDYRILRPDGSLRYIASRGRLVYDEAGQPTRLIGALVDVTERVQAEQERAYLLERERGVRAIAERAAEQTTILQRVTAALTATLTVEQVGRVLVEQSVATLGAYAGMFMLLNEERTALDLVYAAGYPPDLINERQHLPLTVNSPLVDAVQTGELMIVGPQEEWDKRYPPATSVRRNPPTVASVSLPLLVEGVAVGGLIISFTRMPTLDVDDQAMLLTVARQCAQALERARLYDAERRARQIAEEVNTRLKRLQSVTTALAQTLTVEQVAEVVNVQGSTALRAQAGLIALLDESGTRFTLTHTHQLPRKYITSWHGFSTDGNTPASDAVNNGAPVLIHSQNELLARYPQLQSRLWPEFAARAALPLSVEGRTLGVMVLAFTDEQVFPPDEVAFMQTLGRQCAQALERARLYDAERRARERQAFLAEASNALAGSLDYTVTLQTVAQLAVPTIADFCTIHLMQEDGSIRQLAVAHRETAGAAQLEELERRYPMVPDDPHGLPAVIHTRTPILEPDLPATMLHTFAPGDDKRKRLESLQIQSYLCLPLVARDHTLGALSLFTAGDDARRYNVDDQHLAEELAHRCAQAIDNALLYRAAREAVRTRDTFLSIAAHELKTPLTSLLGNVQLMERRMQRDPTADDRNRKALGVIVEQARRLNKLIGDMMDLSRIELGQLSIAREPVEIGALVQRIVHEVEPTLTRHTVKLTVADGPLVVAGDALRLEQAIQNLLSNGVKYSPGSGEVHITVEQRGDNVCVAVSDQGIGIPAAALPQLFQRFYRAANAQAEQISGVGVGLFVVREIIALHDGTIEVESIEGQGSTFTVLLPLVSDR